MSSIRLVFEKTYESGLWFQGKSLSKYLSAKDAPKRFSYRVQNIARNSSWGLGHTQSAIWGYVSCRIMVIFSSVEH
ncbi:hypothetical protein PRUPE_6G360100 [Prunus persica]|uniref:Uncharacterized protein n=1 Tax=Prunus persica TaxID=3760 RepID=A0A251P0Q5_PRUPE|nr:hypothetical protein PRUPE_6G360100 [Prunus persica]